MSHATDDAREQDGLTDQAAAKVQDAASVAQEKASELREQGSARLRDQFDQRSTDAGSQLRSLAESLRRGGSDLTNDGNANAGQWTAQAADQIDRLGNYLEQADGDQLMREIESFARRRPWFLAGVTVLAGVAVARFVKASAEQRYGDYRAQWASSPRTAASRRSGVHARGELTTPRAGEEQDVPVTVSDDPLARDPYAGRS